MKLKVAVLALFICGAVKADTVYDISGVVTSIGNAGAEVTLDYSYDVDAVSNPIPYELPFYIVGPESVSGTGALGDVFTIGRMYNAGAGAYVPITDGIGDEIDLLSGSGAVPFLAEWWTCWNACIPDFMPPGFPPDFDVVNAGGNWGAAPFTMTQTVTATNTPEAPTGLLIIFGISAIAAGKRVLLKSLDNY